jgi:AraC family transcriptional regulator
MQSASSSGELSTGLRTYDRARFSSTPRVSEILPLRNGIGGLVRNRIDGPCAVVMPKQPDHIILVVLESYAIRVRVDRDFDGAFNSRSTAVFPAGGGGRWEADSGAGAVIHLHVSPKRLAAIVESEPEFRNCGALATTFNRDDPVVASLAYAVREETREGRPGCRLLLDTLFQSLCVHLLRQYARNSVPYPARLHAIAPYRLSRAKEFIADNLAESIGIEDIALAAGLSPYHFSRCFREAIGVPPYQYVRLKRLELARRLLEESDSTLSEIAASCGFTSQQHLSEAFRDHLGTSPSRYRRERKGNA